jgi:hypothetical protein
MPESLETSESERGAGESMRKTYSVISMPEERRVALRRTRVEKNSGEGDELDVEVVLVGSLVVRMLVGRRESAGRLNALGERCG